MIARRTLLRSAVAASVLASFAAPSRAEGASSGNVPDEIKLWPGTPPGRGKASGPEEIGTKGASIGAVSNISVPRMRVFRPDRPNGVAILMCGGGGYFRIQIAKETTPVALWLQARGFTVFDLLYRLPADGWDANVPFMDAQRAMKIIRTRAPDFGVNPARIGIMGFSAGGHLAGFTALQSGRALYDGNDRFEAASARPDFAALLFPVVSLRKPYLTRTRRYLIGETPSEAAEAAWSLDTYAAKESPPTIIFAAADDPTTPPGHAITLFQALIAKGASAELHFFEKGGHGWGLGTPDQTLNQWPEMFQAWITRRKFD